ncbi:MAG: recombinase family protein [Phycisphaerae bacterium]|jgi:DNA invertase Pin-like site-specific DNA recombinase
MKRVAYLRVSTEKQDHDMQRFALERYLSAQGITVEFYEEYGSGGSTKRRPVFNRLMREVARKEISHIYVYRLDRWARNTKDFLVTHEVMENAGCKFISTQDSIDFSTPIGRMFAQMLAVFAEFERSTISSRVSAGRRAAADRGVKFGRPKAKVVIRSELIALIRQTGCVKLAAKALGIGKSKAYEILKRAS